jgi:imidazolonepropionase-like amidohydrolase
MTRGSCSFSRRSSPRPRSPAYAKIKKKPGAAARQLEAAFPTLSEKFRQLRAAGLQVVIGTDCGSEANFQADAIWWEMETWRQLGVPPHEILRAATTLPAALLRQPDLGHLRPGARGDFLLYRGDLNKDTLSVQRVRAVAKGGNLFVDEGEWRGP